MSNPMEEKELPIALPEPIAPSPEPASDKSDVNWDEFSDEQDSGENVEEVEGDTEILTESHPGESDAPASVPAPEVPPTQPLPSSTPIEPEIPPAPTAPVAPVTPPIPVPSTAPFDAAAWETEQVSKLEKMYAVSEDDANKLQTEPELVLPQMAARMHMEITKTLLTAMQSIVPDIISNQQSLRSADEEARTAFYSANPDLNDPKYEQAVLKVAGMYRAANPTASRAEAVKTIGTMVRLSLGLTSPTNEPPSPPVTSQQQLPQTARQVPFSPARGGGAAAPNRAPSVWDEMSRDD